MSSRVYGEAQSSIKSNISSPHNHYYNNAIRSFNDVNSLSYDS